ncbi:hypothetical protein [Streptomyces sp. TRM68367]|uniref:hypothetical protein n=1 Tax=Streptomyces sp. TRM68367 TaxID=2758415 RepID=UPI00165AF0E4|nr:hypothetical protein [Streptomyces sp. TRM68367]MBC9729911.1 hypothetical protein [Streptomyces sp. TRM68367]
MGLAAVGLPTRLDRLVREDREDDDAECDLPELAHDEPDSLNRVRSDPLPRVELDAVRIVAPGVLEMKHDPPSAPTAAASIDREGIES